MEFISKKVELTPNDFSIVINNGKYTHELFTNFENSPLAAKFTSQPFPGQYLLFLAGGLAESSEDLPKDIIALSSFVDVNFYRPGLIGDEIYLKMAILTKEVKKYIYKWEIFNDQNILLIDCKVNFLRHVKK
tara:strand:- start:762 stop:1157 length:396 start_codon:yes stop_codon:yes gene_type:complete